MRWTVRRCCVALAMAAGLALSGCGGGAKDDQLDDLAVDQAELVPAFDPDTPDYTAEVANDATSVTVTPTAEDSAATVTVNGTAVASGTASPPIDLVVGDNTITIVVTADDGDTSTYTVVVTRLPPPGTNPDLADLTLTTTDLDQIFDGDVTDYTASTGYLGAFARVVAEPEDPGAMLTLQGMPFMAGEPSHYVALAPGSNLLDIVSTAEDGNASRTYRVDVTRASRATLHQEAYVKADNTGPDAFGTSVSLSRDTLVAGAPEEGSAAGGVNGDGSDNSLLDPGAAYVFTRSGTTWVQSAYLKAANPDGDDRFGDVVAADGDLVAVGAPGEESLVTGINGDDQNDSSSLVGAVYLFERDGMDVWSQSAFVKADNADQGDRFGAAVDLDRGRVIVGAWSEDAGAADVDGDGGNDNLPGSGAAYLFRRDDAGEWFQEAYLKASNPDAGDELGRAVAVSGDTAAAGAPQEDGAATRVDGDGASDSLSAAGAAYVFSIDDTGEWSPAAYLKASNTDAGDRFGSALALDGDLLVVGAPGEDGASAGLDGDEEDDSLDGAGAVYVFERDDAGVWIQNAYVKASNPGSGDGFGTSVALSGNVLAVSAPGENSAAFGLDGDERDDSAVDAGAVYVYERDADGDWHQVVYVKASNADSGDEFGGGLALDGDTLAVGAALEDSGETGINGDDRDDTVDGAGAVYVVR